MKKDERGSRPGHKIIDRGTMANTFNTQNPAVGLGNVYPYGINVLATPVTFPVGSINPAAIANGGSTPSTGFVDTTTNQSGIAGLKQWVGAQTFAAGAAIAGLSVSGGADIDHLAVSGSTALGATSATDLNVSGTLDIGAAAELSLTGTIVNTNPAAALEINGLFGSIEAAIITIDGAPVVPASATPAATTTSLLSYNGTLAAWAEGATFLNALLAANSPQFTKNPPMIITSGATNGYVLTSDASGNMTLQASGSSILALNNTFTGSNTFDNAVQLLALTIGDAHGNIYWCGTNPTSNSSNNNNVAIGSTGVSNSPLSNITAATYNVAIGSAVLDNLGAGVGNVGIGTNSGGGLTGGNGNTFLGYQTTVTGVPGSITASTAIGYLAAITGSHQIVLGTSSEKVYMPGTFQLTSGGTNGYVMTSDASGNATWQANAALGGASLTANQTFSGTNTFSQPIQFTNATEAFTYATGAGTGKILTSDSSGNATWAINAAASLTGTNVFSGTNTFTGSFAVNTNSTFNYFAHFTNEVIFQSTGFAFQFATGASNGYVMTSDASGNASWAAAATGGASLSGTNTWTATNTFNNSVVFANATKAFVYATGAAAGDQMTSDASGNATWQTFAANLGTYFTNNTGGNCGITSGTNNPFGSSTKSVGVTGPLPASCIGNQCVILGDRNTSTVGSFQNQVVAIGYNIGGNSGSTIATSATVVGSAIGNGGVGSNSTIIGCNSNQGGGGSGVTAIGSFNGSGGSLGAYSTNLGYAAGENGVGSYAVNIGYGAGATTASVANSICMNANNTTAFYAPSAGLFVQPVRSVTGVGGIALSYNTTTGEINRVSDKLVTPGLQMTTSPTSGYVMTSDGSGNGTWQATGAALLTSVNTFTQENIFSSNNGVAVQLFAINGGALANSGSVTSGTVTAYQPNIGSSYKEVVIGFNNYVGTYSFSFGPFSITPYSEGTTACVSTIGLLNSTACTGTCSSSTTGFIFLKGF